MDRGKYYTLCDRADKLLQEAKLGPITMKHCEFICESLRCGKPITPRALKALVSPASTAPADSSPSTRELFGSGGTESS